MKCHRPQASTARHYPKLPINVVTTPEQKTLTGYVNILDAKLRMSSSMSLHQLSLILLINISKEAV